MLLDALQSASIRLLGQKPSAFFNATDKFALELCDLVNEVAQDVVKYRDWQALQSVETLTGDGATSAFPLPADFDRMNVSAGVQNLDSWAWGYSRYGSVDEFLFDQARDFTRVPGGWIIYGDQMRFAPAPPAGQSATFPYISTNIVRDANGTPKPKFTADTDTFVLPERLLTLGLVWRWRENKKLDASGDQEAFVKALDEVAAKDGGSKVIRYGGRYSSFRNTYPAWPNLLGSVGGLEWGQKQW